MTAAEMVELVKRLLQEWERASKTTATGMLELIKRLL